MVSERNRILNVKNYIETLGIKVNLGKNKARGHKGFFKAQGNSLRIDISTGLDDSAVLRTLAHEFAHYIHYTYDNKLKSLDFLSENFSNEMLEEMLNLTVLSLPKDSVKPLFVQKEMLEKEIGVIRNELLLLFPTQKEDLIYKKIEQEINKHSYKYLIKYDNVKIHTPFLIKTYSIHDLEAKESIKLYLNLLSKQRLLKRIKSKIARANKYYNQPTELWARSFEYYATKSNIFFEKCPNLARLYEEIYHSGRIPSLTGFINQIY